MMTKRMKKRILKLVIDDYLLINKAMHDVINQGICECVLCYVLFEGKFVTLLSNNNLLF